MENPIKVLTEEEIAKIEADSKNFEAAEKSAVEEAVREEAVREEKEHIRMAEQVRLDRLGEHAEAEAEKNEAFSNQRRIIDELQDKKEEDGGEYR